MRLFKIYETVRKLTVNIPECSNQKKAMPPRRRGRGGGRGNNGGGGSDANQPTGSSHGDAEASVSQSSDHDAPAPTMTLSKWLAMRLDTFDGTGTPMEASSWLHTMEKYMGALVMTPQERVVFVDFQLKGLADV
ncbi:uncharacterized protein LOC112270974 [Brachypodium distachyon]|uniref:uncharacterized protein LOC112270974 n=1 Tax=Brachypodium distachyon TaxID=15368 RepID=UPI000D0D90CE|nr:uncharacterized protein LOC112270974 [Brachypodium distachyon]|eukprot:XP_024315542.1 uncharacterized protein LOC112270974 [Brachypodium distachyon]